MGYTILKNGDTTNYGIKHFMVDKLNDLKDFTTILQPGSTAYCFETNKKYMLDAQYRWQVMKNSGGGGGGNTTPVDPSDLEIEAFFDGGNISNP